MTDADPGVPGALARALRTLAERTGTGTLDRVWLFPPMRKGRRESGLVAAGCFLSPPAGERRLVVTLAYRAEESGKGIAFDHAFQEEGEAPDDRLPRVIEGVVQRSEEALGEPRPVPLGGDAEAFEALVADLEPDRPDAPAYPTDPAVRTDSRTSQEGST